MDCGSIYECRLLRIEWLRAYDLGRFTVLAETSSLHLGTGRGVCAKLWGCITCRIYVGVMVFNVRVCEDSRRVWSI